jgi:hypothetical protein
MVISNFIFQNMLTLGHFFKKIICMGPTPFGGGGGGGGEGGHLIVKICHKKMLSWFLQEKGWV